MLLLLLLVAAPRAYEEFRGSDSDFMMMSAYRPPVRIAASLKLVLSSFAPGEQIDESSPRNPNLLMARPTGPGPQFVQPQPQPPQPFAPYAPHTSPYQQYPPLQQQPYSPFMGPAALFQPQSSFDGIYHSQYAPHMQQQQPHQQQQQPTPGDFSRDSPTMGAGAGGLGGLSEEPLMKLPETKVTNPRSILRKSSQFGELLPLPLPGGAGAAPSAPSSPERMQIDEGSGAPASSAAATGATDSRAKKSVSWKSDDDLVERREVEVDHPISSFAENYAKKRQAKKAAKQRKDKEAKEAKAAADSSSSSSSSSGAAAATPTPATGLPETPVPAAASNWVSNRPTPDLQASSAAASATAPAAPAASTANPSRMMDEVLQRRGLGKRNR